MSDALLPCPFCGGVQIEAFHHIDRGWGASWHVECVAEECGNSTCHHDTEANAIAAWNTRQPAPSDTTQADTDAMESILWVDTIIDDKEAIAKAFARHRIAAIEECAKALQDDAKLCDCFAREVNECACGAWDDYKSITSARAVEIVRKLADTQ
jgi:hypothetical protein